MERNLAEKHGASHALSSHMPYREEKHLSLLCFHPSQRAMLTSWVAAILCAIAVQGQATVLAPEILDVESFPALQGLLSPVSF